MKALNPKGPAENRRKLDEEQFLTKRKPGHPSPNHQFITIPEEEPMKRTIAVVTVLFALTLMARPWKKKSMSWHSHKHFCKLCYG